MYGEQAYMWTVAELLRKLVLTSLILLFFDQGSALQVTFALLVSAFAHVAHALWRPYTDRRAYLLQHGSLAVTTLVYVALPAAGARGCLTGVRCRRYAFGLLFKVRGFSQGATGTSTTAGDDQEIVFDVLGVALVAMCAAFLAWGAVLVLMSLCRAGVRQVKLRKSGYTGPTAEERRRLELRRRGRMKRRQGRAAVATTRVGDVQRRPRTAGTSQPAAGHQHSGGPGPASGDVGNGETTTWHANPMRDNSTASESLPRPPSVAGAAHGRGRVRAPLMSSRGRRTRASRGRHRASQHRITARPSQAAASVNLLTELRHLRRHGAPSGSA